MILAEEDLHVERVRGLLDAVRGGGRRLADRFADQPFDCGVVGGGVADE